VPFIDDLIADETFESLDDVFTVRAAAIIFAGGTLATRYRSPTQMQSYMPLQRQSAFKE